MNPPTPANTPLHLLVVEDIPKEFERIENELKQSGLHFSAVCIDGPDELSNELSRQEPDLILYAYDRARLDGFNVLEVVRARNPELPFIVVTKTLEESEMAEALARGADEIVPKQRLNELSLAVHRARRLCAVRRQVVELQRERERLRAEIEAWRYGRPRLPSVLPICAGCKKICTGEDDWDSLEHYFREHFNIRFSHGICPVCMTTHSRAAI